ncbi:hypothetical protein M9Y10_000709 [Tritrichomonas musculus]|uniref:Uncharacterized protein n=1 Tax=Tritrichomonas musculus TaxID=1915356 RepID=A0ABR2L5D3_9EUKA
MDTNKCLAVIQSKYSSFQEYFSSINTNSTIIFPNKLEVFSGDQNNQIPTPPHIKCYINPNSKDTYKHKLILPFSSAQQIFNYEKEVFIWSLNYFGFCIDRDQAEQKFNIFIDPEGYTKIEDEFKSYFNYSEFKGFLELLNPINSIKLIKYKLGFNTFYESFKDTSKTKCLVMNNIIYPAFLNCQKLQKIISNETPCSLTVYDSDSLIINKVTKIDEKNRYYITKFLKDLHDDIFNEEKESIEIFHSIAERIHAFKCQVNQNEILKQCEEKFNSLNLNEESVSQLCEFSNATDQKSNNSIEKLYIVKAYYLSLFMYNVSLYGVGQYNHQYINICGVRVLSNTSNSFLTKFTFILDAIPEITYQFCYEVLSSINKVQFISEVSNLRNNNHQNAIDLLKSVNLQAITQEYHNTYKELENEISNYREIIASRCATTQVQVDFNSIIQAIASTIQMTEVLIIFFSDIIPHMKDICKKIKELESKRGLITWIEKVQNLNENIIALEVEKINDDDIRIREINNLI